MTDKMRPGSLPTGMLVGWLVLVAVAGRCAARPRAARWTRRPSSPLPSKADKADDEADKAEDVAEKHFPGGAALKTDPEQQRLLKRAEQCVEDGRLDLAAVLWQKVLDEAGDTLMYPRRLGPYVHLYTSLAEHVERTLSKLPPLALATYRISCRWRGPGGAGRRRTRQRGRSPGRKSCAGSSSARTATTRPTSSLAWPSTDTTSSAPAGCSRGFSNSHPDPSMPRGEILLRLAVASARMGDQADGRAVADAIGFGHRAAPAAATSSTWLRRT